MRVAADKVISQEHVLALGRLCKHTKDKELFLHAQALLLRSQGKTLKQIREALGIPESTVKFYTRRLKQEGVEGLMYQGQSGNHRLLTKEQWKELRILLASMEGWNIKDIPTLLAYKFGVKYAHSHSYVEVLERAGYIYEPAWGYYITPETQEQYKDVINGIKALEREFRENPLPYPYNVRKKLVNKT